MVAAGLQPLLPRPAVAFAGIVGAQPYEPARRLPVDAVAAIDEGKVRSAHGSARRACRWSSARIMCFSTALTLTCSCRAMAV